MRKTALLPTPILALSLCAQIAFAETDSAARPYTDPGSYRVETATVDWVDAKRGRNIPAKIYFPTTGNGPFPVLLFSHGLGGTRDGYAYLGRQWASHGYVSVHLQHIGSDDAVWKNVDPRERLAAMRRAAANPRNAIDRPLDVSFAIDQMERLNRESGPLRGRLDLKHIGVAGHSFGAYTTLAIAGERFVGPWVEDRTLCDPRVGAAIPMSSPVPRDKSHLDRIFGSIRIPCLHMTGTKDSSVINDTQPAERRLPFDHIHGADQYLVTFTGGDHMIFSGRGRRTGGEHDARFQELILASSTAFWDTYLKGDATAKTWLCEGGFREELGPSGTFESKRGDADSGLAGYLHAGQSP